MMRYVCAFFVFFWSFLHCAEAPEGIEVAVSVVEEPSVTDSDRSEGLPLNEKQAAVNHEAPKKFSLAPHKAEYEISFNARKSKVAGIKDVNGTSTVEIIKTKEGWSYKQQLSVQVTHDDGNTTIIEKDVATWESLAESSFHVEDKRDGALESTFQGQAEYNESTGWQVSFETPGIDGFITPKLLFPIGYLEKTLTAIENNKKVLSDQVVFDAAFGIQKPVRIDTVITKSKTKELAINGQAYQTWQLQQALYDFKSQSPIPDYESNNLEVTANGVIVAMETAWGEGITVTLKLQSLTFYQ